MLFVVVAHVVCLRYISVVRRSGPCSMSTLSVLFVVVAHVVCLRYISVVRRSGPCRGRQAKVGPGGKVGHPHHSKSGECYGKNNYASF